MLSQNSRILKADWEFKVHLRREICVGTLSKNTERKRRRGEGRREEEKSNLWIVFPSQQGLTKSNAVVIFPASFTSSGGDKIESASSTL